MGDADTGNDHLSDVDLPSQSALASLAEQPGDAAAKPRPKAAKLLKEKNSDSLPFDHRHSDSPYSGALTQH